LPWVARKRRRLPHPHLRLNKKPRNQLLLRLRLVRRKKLKPLLLLRLQLLKKNSFLSLLDIHQKGQFVETLQTVPFLLFGYTHFRRNF
jgi:hypothetical protein